MEQNRLFKDINKNLVTREAEILNKGKFHALNKIIYKLGDLELTQILNMEISKRNIIDEKL